MLVKRATMSYLMSAENGSSYITTRRVLRFINLSALLIVVRHEV